MKKRIISLLLAFIMTSAVCAQAMAADTDATAISVDAEDASNNAAVLDGSTLVMTASHDGLTMQLSFEHFIGFTDSMLKVNLVGAEDEPLETSFMVILLPEDFEGSFVNITMLELPETDGDVFVSQGFDYDDDGNPVFANMAFDWGDGKEITADNCAIVMGVPTWDGAHAVAKPGESIALPLNPDHRKLGVAFDYVEVGNDAFARYVQYFFNAYIALTPEMADEIVDNGTYTDPFDGRVIPIGEYFPELGQMIADARAEADEEPDEYPPSEEEAAPDKSDDVVPPVEEETPGDPEPIPSPTSSALFVDGAEIEFSAYNIAYNNYFTLGDLAAMLSGSDKQFTFAVDEESGVYAIAAGEAYESVVEDASSDNTDALPGIFIVNIGDEVFEIVAYTIGGSVYFKLRDIAGILDFSVVWDGAANSIFIDTTEGYTAQV